MKFEVGDLVYVYKMVNTPTHVLTGKIGCIKHIQGKDIGVEFSEPIGGHDLNGHCLKPFGYYLHTKDIKKMEPVVNLIRNQVEKWLPKVKVECDLIILIEEK